MRVGRVLRGAAEAAAAERARQAVELSNEYRLYEAHQHLLPLLGPSHASVVALRSEIARLEDEMAAWRPPRPKSFSRHAPKLPPTVRAVERSGQLGLIAQRSFQPEEVVFTETPLAVVAPPDACRMCLRPLAPRRALSQNGSPLSGPPPLDALFAAHGVPPFAPRDGCCSDACRSAAIETTTDAAAADDVTSRLMAKLGPDARRAALRCLQGADEQEPREDEPHDCAEPKLWRVVRKNAVEAVTRPLAWAASVGAPIVDAEHPGCHGSALFLCASLINHHCSAANLAPEFLDSLTDTPFVALRPIAAGEELFFDYATLVAHPKDKRLRNFLTHGFVCDCD